MTYDLLKPLVADSMALSYLQEALHASESKLRIFVEHSVDGFILIDADGRIMMWSAAQERIIVDPAVKTADHGKYVRLFSIKPSHPCGQSTSPTL